MEEPMQARTSERECDQLRREIAATPKNGRGHRRYEAKLKRRAQQYVERQRATGTSLIDVSRDLRVSMNTLWGWVRPEPSVPKVRAVKVALPTSPPAHGGAVTGHGIVVVMPNGVRIEGLQADHVASIVRGLS
jgi:hypothetical protein